MGKENKNLKGDELKAAVDKQAWDESVKSLVATPDVLAMMSTKLDWTQKLGDAVLAQQPDVMDAIQRLRAKAEANNKLTSTKEQKVTKKQEQGKQVIVIEPTEPNTVYVPYYDPAVAYGGWPYPAYPPYYFPPPGYIAGGIIAGGIAFGAGYALGRWASGGNYWGGGCNWGNNNININRPVNINTGGNNWQHKPEHRQGVKYNNANVQQKFGNNNIRSGSQDRMDYRGRGGEQVLKPGGSGRPILAIVEARPVQAVALRNPVPDKSRVQVAAALRSLVQDKSRAQAAARSLAEVKSPRAAAMPLGIFSPAKWRTRSPRVETQASAPTAAVVAVVRERVAAVAAARERAVAVAVAAAVAVAVVAAADGDPISRSSTISFFSAISPTASATIASATTAATELMSA